MKQPQPHFPCRTCSGAGRVPLRGYLLDTYRRLVETGPVHGAELARLMGTTGPAMSMRLTDLQAIGLATSEQHGRRRIFTAVTDR